MTREMIRQIERDYWAEKADPIDMAEIFNLAQRALEQEPTTKNNLGVDAVSRQAVLNTLDNMDSALDEDRTVETYKELLKECYKILPSVTPQEPKFIAKSDGTIEQIKNCNGCVFRKEWEKIGKLLSVVLEKQTEQEPKTGHWIANAPQYDMLNPQYICSECGNAHTRTTPYCEMCGAKMVEPQESEDK